MAKVVQHKWHLFDAQGQVVGRFATHIANVLRGKYKPTFTKNTDCGDTIVIINADKVVFTGKKWEQKVYRKHSGFIGHMNEKRASDIRERFPERILLHAVRGMLPKTMHRLPQLQRLHVYPGTAHPFKHIFPNQPIAATRAESATDLTLHFQVRPEFQEEVEKQLVKIPADAEGNVNPIKWLKEAHPDVYEQTVSEMSVSLTPDEVRAYAVIKARLNRQVAVSKVVQHGADLEKKFKFGTDLDKITIEGLKKTRPELFEV